MEFKSGLITKNKFIDGMKFIILSLFFDKLFPTNNFLTYRLFFYILQKIHRMSSHLV